MMKRSSDGGFVAFFAEVKKDLKRSSKDDFRQSDYLKVAVADESLCKPIIDKDHCPHHGQE